MSIINTKILVLLRDKLLTKHKKGVARVSLIFYFFKEKLIKYILNSQKHLYY